MKGARAMLLGVSPGSGSITVALQLARRTHSGLSPIYRLRNSMVESKSLCLEDVRTPRGFGCC